MLTTKPRILCVDDEPDILKFFEAVLVPRGYEVIRAENGEEALEKLKDQRIDLVISDVRMPKMDGFEVCRLIKEDERYRNLPVIIITGLAGKEDRIKGIEVGAEDFISKPINPEEVLARVKMLLKAKALHEKRIGELFIEMGFITEVQLQKALKIAKEQNIKVGEALYSMGAIDKDHIYWVLSNQLNMNYVELSTEMMDKELIKQFPIEILEQLQCLPLYETAGEINFAIADPTDQKNVKKVKSLNPGKVVQLHLAIPEKIMDILNSFKRDFLLRQHEISFEEKNVQHLSDKTIDPSRISKSESVWKDFLTGLKSMSQGETYWFYKTSRHCKLLSYEGVKFKSISEFPSEIYVDIKERLQQEGNSQHFSGETQFFFQERSMKEPSVFKLKPMNSLDREMIKIERIPAFSQKEFFGSHPQVPGLIEDLQKLFSQHHHLLIGGKDRLLVKQCCYSLLKDNDPADFPPPFFIEREIEIYFPEAAQLCHDQHNVVSFIKQFKETPISFLFYETEFPEITSDEKNIQYILPGIFKNIILYAPFPSTETMKDFLSVRQDWHQTGFKAIFFSHNQLESV